MSADGGPAFPVDPKVADMSPPWLWIGMTLRDYFAAQALQGMLANPDPPDTVHMSASVLAFKFADAMLAERAK